MVVWSGTRFKGIAATEIGEETSYMYLRFTAKNLTLKSWSINFINFHGVTINFWNIFRRLKQLNCFPLKLSLTLTEQFMSSCKRVTIFVIGILCFFKVQILCMTPTRSIFQTSDRNQKKYNPSAKKMAVCPIDVRYRLELINTNTWF